MTPLTAIVHRFGEFEFDLSGGRLFRGTNRVPLSDPHAAILACLITYAGQVVSKDTLVRAAWPTQAVSDDNFLQGISRVRKALRNAEGVVFIETVQFRGYRFTADVQRAERHRDALSTGIDLSAYRAFIQGRADLHTLNRDRIRQARAAFEDALQRDPEYVDAHVGLANACALAFEGTRTDLTCDLDSLERAARYARQATLLAPASGEAWSALAFALSLQGHRLESEAAARKAIALEPDNWQHHLRLAFVSWGEHRIRAARTMLEWGPGVALGHWLIATVLIARGAFDAALRVLQEGCAAQDAQPATLDSFPAVGLHLLRGLVLGAQQRVDAAIDALNRELSGVDPDLVYGRECAANTWYALGAMHRRQGRHADAEQAFAQALRVAPAHVFALAVLGRPLPDRDTRDPRILEARLARATALAAAGRHADAAESYRLTVVNATHPLAGWMLPVDPVLDPASHPDVWVPALAVVRTRAL
jgi:DNA-binding winged helix-turn-helix (wHTH) protein/Flp pilus assembly protein TadD